MDYPLLIPGIIEKIDSVMARLCLVPKETPADFVLRTNGKKHRYSSICEDKNKNRVLFYASLHGKELEKQRMETETKIAEVFIKKNPSSPYFPKYISAGTENEFSWLTREVFPEGPIEEKKEIEKLGTKIKIGLAKDLVKSINFINDLPIEKFPFLEKFEIKKYLDLVEQSKDMEKEGIFSGEDSEKIKALIFENKQLLEKQNKFFTHGDLQIGNIIIFGKKIKIIDFESSHLNNFAFDVAFLVTRLWREPETRKEIMKIYLKLLSKEKKQTFCPLFRIDSFFVAYHAFRSRPREYSPEILETRKNFYLQLMKSALNGFEELISL